MPFPSAHPVRSRRVDDSQVIDPRPGGAFIHPIGTGSDVDPRVLVEQHPTPSTELSMTILQNTRFRVAAGIAAVVLAVAAIGAGTYAAFNDTESGPDGAIASGTLDLVVGAAPGTVNLFSATNIKPGFTQDVTFQVGNTGSIPGTLTSTMLMTGADVTCTEPEYAAEGVGAGACAALGNLQEQMTVAVVAGPNGAVAAAPLSQFVTSGLPLPGTLAPGASTTYTLRFAFPDLAGTTNNRAQGDSINITSTFNLVQA
jgi:spore coat-associated protein N